MTLKKISVSNIRSKNETLQNFDVTVGVRQGYPFSTLLIQLLIRLLQVAVLTQKDTTVKKSTVDRIWSDVALVVRTKDNIAKRLVEGAHGLQCDKNRRSLEDRCKGAVVYPARGNMVQDLYTWK